MSYLLKIEAILVCVGSGIAVGYVDGNVVIVAVGEVDVITTAIGVIWYGSWCRVDLVVAGVVRVHVVDFDADVSVAHIIVKDPFFPSVSTTKCVAKSESSKVATTFEPEAFVALRASIHTEVMRPQERDLVAQQFREPVIWSEVSLISVVVLWCRFGGKLPRFALKSGAQSTSELQSGHVLGDLQPYNLVDMGTDWAVAVRTGAAYGGGGFFAASTPPRAISATAVAHVYILPADPHPITLILLGVTTTTAAQRAIVFLVAGINDVAD